MNILIANTHVPFVTGGAEQLADDLAAACIERGHRAEVLRLPFTHIPEARVLDQLLAYRLFDLAGAGNRVDHVVALKFPAYLLDHPSKSTWLCHQHRQVYDMWDHPHGAAETAEGSIMRAAITGTDREELSRITARYTISANVSGRLDRYCGLSSTPLPPPVSGAERFQCLPAEDFLYLPSRIVWHKRQDLAIQALAHCDPKIRLVVSGAPASPASLERVESVIEQLGLEDRVVLAGRVSEQEKLDLYARCRAVVFVPFDEDYGYITPEAMLASKPVITCTDSGGSLDFVVDEQTGLVVEPDPEALGVAYDRLLTPEAAAWGPAGRERYASVVATWDEIVERLLQPATP